MKNNIDIENGVDNSDYTSIQNRVDMLEEQLKKIYPGISNRSANESGSGAVHPVANPSPLGLFGFAIVSWLSGILKVTSPSVDGSVALTGTFVGGIAQVIAGILHYMNNNAHSATTFSLYGLHWIVRGTYMHALAAGIYPSNSNKWADFAYYLLLAASTFLLWIPSLRMNKVLSITLLMVTGVFILDAVAALESRSIEIIAGTLSCFAASMAFYLCATDLVNETWKKFILPVYPHHEHKEDYHHLPYFPRLHYHKSVTASIHH